MRDTESCGGFGRVVGIGARLLAHVIEEVKRRSEKCFFLEVRESNSGAGILFGERICGADTH